MHHTVQRELTDVVVEPLSLVFQKLSKQVKTQRLEKGKHHSHFLKESFLNRIDVICLVFCKAFGILPLLRIFVLLNWRYMALMDGLLDKELAGWLHPKSCDQQVSIQMEISNK